MSQPLLIPDTIITGKWNKNKYKVLKKLGEGGMAAVYKVECISDKKIYALKLSEDNISLNREYELIKSLNTIKLIASAYEIDDVNIGGKIYHYIIIEYIPGITLNKYKKNKSVSIAESIGIVLILLKLMGELHENGYILGDSKLDNIMVNWEGKVIRIIDLGGVVKLGSPIKEFTPAYDRASWTCGDRISEESYDLFSSAMILVQLLLGIDFPRPSRESILKIKEDIMKKDFNEELKLYLIDVLEGRKKNVKDFANILFKLYNKEIVLEKNRCRKKSSDLKVNIYFAGSLSLFIYTVILILNK